jgi:hypothetical protein
MIWGVRTVSVAYPTKLFAFRQWCLSINHGSQPEAVQTVVTLMARFLLNFWANHKPYPDSSGVWR